MTTAVTAAHIALLRRFTAEPLGSVYSDAVMISIIESYPTLDENGEPPRIAGEDSGTTGAFTDPSDLVPNTYWIPTFDLNAAASQIWEEKAAVIAGNYDFSADGGSYSRSQAFEQYMKLSRQYLAKRKAKTVHLHPVPRQAQ